MSRLHRVVLPCLGLFLVLQACGEGTEVANPLYPGQTDFTNSEPASGYDNGDLASPKAGGMESSDAPAEPPQGRSGAVEEADIYKVQGNTLFYLNTYRGFLIYDLTDTKTPVAISRLPVYGYPIEMFVQNNTVYALIRDALYLTQVKGKLQFKRRNVSQLVAIDISDLAQPKILQTVDIIGELREGVSRKIEDTIYVVSYQSRYYYWDWNYGYSNSQGQKEQAWVHSFNVANPKNLTLVDKLKVFEGGGYSASDPTNGYQSRYFQDVAISATSNALMVVENWQTYGSVSGSKYNCGSYTSQQQAVVSIIDISDPQGQIHLHTKFETYGHLGDQFKQTYVFDDKTNTGTYLGIFARREWASINCSGTSLTQNTLESWDVTDGNNPRRLDALPFGKPNETVRGSVFDPARSVVFAITAQSVDPLYALSFANRSTLAVLSEVDGLSGDMNVFRFIENNQFLIAIGRDNSSACTGFGSPTTGWSTNVAVSVIDVQNLNNISLVQRQCVAVKDAAWISSELNWNLDQAHKMIGMHSDGKANVITVPVYYRKQTTDGWWWYGYETAVGLMTWDLAGYDPSKPPEQQNVLTNYGTIIHPKGEVKRSIVFTHQGATNRRKVINLSTTHVSVADIEDLNHPQLDTMIEVAPYKAELYRFGGYLVEHVRPEPYYYYSSDKLASEFRVKPVGGQLDQAATVASFTVPNVERVVPFKDNLIIFRRVGEQKTNTYGSSYYEWKPQVLVYSLADPKNPKQIGMLNPPDYFPDHYYNWYWFGPWGYWGGYWFDYYGYGTGGFVVNDKGLLMLTYSYDSTTHSSQRKLAFLDLTNPAKPTTKEFPLTSSSSWMFYGLVGDPSSSDFYLTYRIKVGTLSVDGDTFNQYKYYAQRWSHGASGWVAGPAINLPGRLMKTWSSGNQRLFLTHDYTYKKVTLPGNSYVNWKYTFRINMLRELAPLAQLLDTHSFDGFYLRDTVLDGDTLFVNARPDYYSQQELEIPWYEVSDHLMIFDLSNLTLSQRYSEPTGTYQVRMMGTYKGKLFLNLPGDGILAVDVSDPSNPVGQQFLRTLGWATHLEFADDTAYVCSGYFGVYQMQLKAPPALAYQ